MAILRQTTLNNPIFCAGVGLHSGTRVTMTLAPAEADTGIRFVRTDLAGDKAVIPALYDRVVDTKLCTVIGNEAGTTVGTVEHLMAALAGQGVDNAEIRLDAGEVPIMDGSSSDFVFLIESAGIAELSAPRRAIQLHEKISVGGNGADGTAATLSPAPMAIFEGAIDFPSAAIGRQERVFRLTEGAFKRDLARARTFGFVEQVDQLRKIGLARGASLENAVGIEGDKVLNIGGLRWADEFVRHKLLDAVGDLALAGLPILGRYRGHRAGHAVHNQLLRALFDRPAAWSIVELEAPSLAEPVRATA